MNRVRALISFIFIVVLASAQKRGGPVANYTFNKGNANDDLGRHHAKAFGAKLTADRFGNENAAYYLQGNPDSYINLGTSRNLKPTRGTISLWVKTEQPIYKGNGVPNNPIIITKSHSGEDFNEAFYIGYHLDLKNITVAIALSENDQVNLCPSTEMPIRIKVAKFWQPLSV